MIITQNFYVLFTNSLLCLTSSEAMCKTLQITEGRVSSQWTGGAEFDARPHFAKVGRNRTSCSSLDTQMYWVKVGLVDDVSIT